MADRGFILTRDGVRLECEVGPSPEGPRGVAVVCHPHPLGGGDMRNRVVMALAGTARDAGLLPLRFNFRGTGRSGGVHSGGRKEVADVDAAVARARELGGGPLVIMGYSFGAAMAARWLATGGRADAFVAVALPEAMGEPELGGVPTLLVAGAHDDISPPEYNAGLARSRGLTHVILPGTDHFFASVEGLERAVRDYLEDRPDPA